MSFAFSNAMTSKTEDFPSSSISVNVSNAFTVPNSVTRTSSGNPDTNDHSLHELSDDPEEPQSRKERLTAWQIPEPLGYGIILKRMLVRHVMRHHGKVHKNHLEAEAKLASENKASGCQQYIQPFLVHYL